MTQAVVLPFHQDDRLDVASFHVPGSVATTVVDPPLPDGDLWSRLVALYDAQAAQVAQAVPLADGCPVLVLTGDCLAAAGTVAGAQRAGVDPSVVWFDAHGDLHTLTSSSSGYLGGMALRMLLGGDRDRLADPLGLVPVRDDRVVLVDGRDLDPAEADYLEASAVRRATVDSVGPDALPAGPVVIHVDVDVLDPAHLAEPLFPVPGGPSTDQVLDALRRLVDGGQVVAVDVALAWRDTTDPAELARRTALVEGLRELVDGPVSA